MLKWLKHFENWPKNVVILGCLLFIMAVGFVDYITGYETFFFTFYLLAIFMGTWRVNAAFGIWLSALSVTAWISSNIVAGEHYQNPFVPLWNATIMFTIYVIIVLLLGSLKRINEELEERVRLRTAALTREIQERMRLQKELLETSDREQRRIARELHDGLCQHLTGTALAGHLLEQKLAGNSPAGAGEASRLTQLIEEAIELTRNLSHELDPVELKSGQLTDHLEDLAADISNRFKVACQFQCAPMEPLTDAAVATHLFRIARDAALNAVRHSHAKHIEIGLDSAAGEVALTITDDGVIRPETEQTVGRDISGELRPMAYRADLIGAIIQTRPLPGGGTRVSCVLPAADTEHGTKN